MSDYLGNLVARSLFPPAVVRPRSPSRFEPPGTPYALVPEPDVEPAPSDLEQVMEDSPEADSLLRVQSLPSSKPDIEDTELAVQLPSERIQPETEARVEPCDAGADLPGRAQLPRQDSPPKRAKMHALRLPPNVKSIGAVSPLPLRSQPPVIPPQKVATGERRAEPDHPGVPHREDDSTGNQGIRTSPIPGIPVPAIGGAQTREAPDPGQDHKLGGFANEQKSSFQARPGKLPVTRTISDQRLGFMPAMPIVPASNLGSPRGLRSAPKPEQQVERPSIHVTIGRVEVRATPPPVRSRPQAAQPRGMTLDEYLRRRASGGSQ
jgi:hypothetical protein